MDAGEKYIKKGTVNDATVTVNLGDITSTAGIISSNSTNAYAISVTAKPSATGLVNRGYIKSDTTYSGSSEDSKTAYIAHGSFEVRPSATVSIDSSIGEVVTGEVNSTTHYAITATPVISAISKSGLTEGYIKAADITDGEPSETGSVLAIAKGSASIANGISVSFKNVDTDLPNEDMTSVDIFTGTAPTNRDYYVINSSANIDSFTAGYFADGGNIATSSVATKYLAKADIQLFEDEDGNLAINVLEGGYLPSGLLTTDTTETKLGPANVNLVINSNDSAVGIFSDTETTDAYKLSISKGSVTSGLMSETTGSVTGAFYVAHGKVTIGTSIGALAQTAVTKNTENNKYNITVSGSATTSVSSITAGYVKDNADITLPNNDSVKIEKIVELDAGSVGYDNNTLSITADIDSKVATTTDASKGYSISPKLTGGDITLNTATAGYISENDTFTINLSDDKIVEANKTDLYILKGTGVDWNKPTTGITNTVKATANFDTTQSGDYTVTIEGNASITGKINEGYYEETNINEPGFAIKGQSLTVAHGKVENEFNATASLSSDDIEFISEGTDLTGKEYVTINATVKDVVHTATVTAGYIKDSDVNRVSTVSNTTAAAVDKKIAAVNIATRHANPTDSAETLYCVKVGATEAVALNSAEAQTKTIITATKQAYSKYSTCIELNSHAMGSEVIAAFGDLAARLNGE